MAVSAFDATHAVRFDLPKGSVRAGGEKGERVVLVPAAALGNLVAASTPAAVESLGKMMGEAIGRRTAARADAKSASPEAFIVQLAGETAIAGVGSLSVERWGQALVVLVEDSALEASLLAPLVAGAVATATGRPVSGVLLAHDKGVARILLASERGASRVRGWIQGGSSWGDALAKLQGGGS